MKVDPDPIPTVLIVDDDSFMREVLKHLFDEARICTKTFDSAKQLLEHADLSAPAVLLLDVQMPETSGLQLQEFLKSTGVRLPIIFMTASSDVPTAVQAMRNGAVDFLEKPLDNGLLIARVRQSFAWSTGAGNSVRRVDPQHVARLKLLTAREREIYGVMITGRSNKMIARDLGGSFRTIETHRSRVMRKMKASCLADLVRMTFETEVEGVLE